MSPIPENNEIRKIQFTGRSTYILSLPKRWMSEMRLKAGDPVTIVREANNYLSIIPSAARSPSTIDEANSTVLNTESSNTVKRKVVSMYLAGYNIINLKAKTGRILPSQRDAVRDVVRRNLVGTEIIAAASEIITIQVLLSLPELSINTAVSRMFLIAAAMHRDAMLSLTELNHELAEAVIKSDDEVDRFSLYILRNLVIATQNERILQEIGLRKPSDCLSYRVTVKSIERIADHASGIADKCVSIKDKIDRETLQLIDNMSKRSLALITDAVEAFLRRDYSLADSIVDKANDMRLIENEVLSFIDNSESPSPGARGLNIKLILEDIRRTAEHASDIAEAAMNQTIRGVIDLNKSSRTNNA
ncbi:MAG: phosphate uptake regulator PhoU [Nitrososphaeraceae archaeon]